jgi:hypothetical protein
VEQEELAAERVAAQRLLHLRRQAVEAIIRRPADDPIRKAGAAEGREGRMSTGARAR